MPKDEIPALTGDARRTPSLWEKLKGRRKALLGSAAAVLVAGLWLLMTVPLDERTEPRPAGAPALDGIARWKGPTMERSDPGALITGGDLMAGSDPGGPVAAEPAQTAGRASRAPASDAAPPAPPEGLPKAAVTTPKLSAREAQSFPNASAFGAGRAASEAGSSAMLEADGRARSQTEAHGPVARARRRVSALVRRVSGAGAGLLAAMRRAFGSGTKSGYGAAGGSDPRVATTGEAGASGAASSAGAIGSMGMGRDDGSTPGSGSPTGLTAPPSAGAAKAVNPARPPKDVKCALVKGAVTDFWSAFNKVENVNRRYHSTEDDEKDLLVPLMKRTEKKFAEFDAAIAKVSNDLNSLTLDCEECGPLFACQRLAQQDIGTGDRGDSIDGAIQDVVRAAQKGTGSCAPRAFEDSGAAETCFETGLQAIKRDSDAKKRLLDHLALLAATRDSKCRADEAKGTPPQRQKAREANAAWRDFVSRDHDGLQPILDYLKAPWCSDHRIPCVPVRLGQLREARKSLHNLRGAAAGLSESLGADVGYVSRI
ncbi:MAG: hypothetical protein HY925_07430, partial [Elusimicrobia bacterium]|nr:hypothetical protein [Elusimicrobiota bacterium]